MGIATVEATAIVVMAVLILSRFVYVINITLGIKPTSLYQLNFMNPAVTVNVRVFASYNAA